MAYPPSFWDNYKTRNILSLIDRVRVLREYESYPKRPSFQSIATKFDCSPKQIKNIVMNRDSILRSYHESCSNRNEGLDDTVQKRQEKIEFLGKVMYEYVQRVLFYKYPIDDEKVRQKALQVKECIAVENFHPTSIWLEDFKLTYGIPAFDMETLRNNVPLTEEKHPHLSAIDMIQYVSQQEQEEKLKNYKNSRKRKLPQEHFPDEDDLSGNHYTLEPTIIYESNDDNYDDEGPFNNAAPSSAGDSDHEIEVIKLQNNAKGQEQYRVKIPPMPAAQRWRLPKRRSLSPLPDIESVDEAMRHLKALEEYAMLQDNFRAIGLLTQLEDVFKKQKKK